VRPRSHQRGRRRDRRRARGVRSVRVWRLQRAARRLQPRRCSALRGLRRRRSAGGGKRMTRSLGELAGIALRGVARDQVLGLEFDGLSLRVRTNSAALRQRLADYFRAAVAEPATGALDIIAVQASAPEFSLPFTDWQRDPGKAGRKEAFSDVAGGRVVLKVRTGMQFLIGPELRLGVGDCETNDNQIINFVIAQYIRHSLTDGALLCHSAGVAHHGHGLTIAATSGAGKSTLALHLMS